MCIGEELQNFFNLLSDVNLRKSNYASTRGKLVKRFGTVV